MAIRWNAIDAQRNHRAREEFVGARRQIDGALQQIDRIRKDQVGPLTEELGRLNGGLLQLNRALGTLRARTASERAGVARAAAAMPVTSGELTAVLESVEGLRAALESTLFHLRTMGARLDRTPPLLLKTSEAILVAMRQFEQLSTRSH